MKIITGFLAEEKETQQLGDVFPSRLCKKDTAGCVEVTAL